MKPLFTFFVLLLTLSLTAQTEVTERNADQRAYAANSTYDSPALSTFAAAFPSQNVGFMHIYALGDIDPMSDYLLTGNEMSGSELAMLPKKFQRSLKRENSTAYASAAIRGRTDNLFIIRSASDISTRVDLFGIKDDRVQHLKVLAYRGCTNGKCRQMDSFITDIDGDATLDIMTMARNRNGQEKRAVYVMDRDKKWKKTTKLDAPWESASLYEMK